MIATTELRIGNYILQKVHTRIMPVKFGFKHFELLVQGGDKDLFPLVLKPEILEKCGFGENRDYPLLPEAREFILVLPVIGSNRNEIRAYVKNNKECFGRATVNDLPVSNNLYHLHQLQNLYHALTGQELAVNL